LIWTGIVFLTGQVIFVPEWPKGEFISFCVGFILFGQNHFYVMLFLSQGCCFIQSLLFSYVLQEDSMKFSRKFILVPCQPSGRRGIPAGRSSVSNIRPDEENFPSGPPSVSRSFELFKVEYVRT